jgi:glycine/D-amino acid oxidase-like deaminating enzyme
MNNDLMNNVMSENNKSAIIIGAGIVGLATARALAVRGY